MEWQAEAMPINIQMCSVNPTSVTGNPDPEMICTSHVERANLTMRTFIRRMTRLCLGFSKKLDNLKSAVALYFAWYNFMRIHGSLKVTPAMEAGITDHVWTLGELIGATISRPLPESPPRPAGSSTGRFDESRSRYFGGLRDVSAVHQSSAG